MPTNENKPEDIVVRLAGEVHLDQLTDLLSACADDMRRHGFDQWDQEYPTRATVLADIQSGALFVALAEKEDEEGMGKGKGEGRVVGAFTLNQHQDPEYGEVAWMIPALPVAVVHRLMVHPNAQRMGLGRFLMRFAERRAWRMGFRALRLDTLEKNARALALYRALGYHEAGQVTFRGKGRFTCFEKALAR
jgi:GNAT superfamily N-acetyltransferase